jgi:ABC-type branched-subunit amino acid transport system substrate-binding protein
MKTIQRTLFLLASIVICALMVQACAAPQPPSALDAKQVRDALAKENWDSFYGHIQFDERGLNVYKTMAVAQNQTDGNI